MLYIRTRFFDEGNRIKSFGLEPVLDFDLSFGYG
jgi:hypothetical protein